MTGPADLVRTRLTDSRIDAALAPRRGGVLNTGRLRQGDILWMGDHDGQCIVDYVNPSGAYIVPTQGNTRIVNGRSITFRRDGFYIGVTSLVEIIGHIDNYTSRLDRRRDTMGTREGALKAAATRKRRAEEAAAAAQGVPLEAVPGLGPSSTPGELVETAQAGTDGADEAGAGQASTVSYVGDPEADPDTLPLAETGAEEADMATAQARQRARKSKGDKRRSKAAAGSTARAAKRAGGTKREAKPKEQRDCSCGCGGKTGGYFVMGHDARFKGWMLQIERGEESKSKLLTPAVIRAYTWVPTKGGGERTTTNYKGEPHKGYDKVTD